MSNFNSAITSDILLAKLKFYFPIMVMLGNPIKGAYWVLNETHRLDT
jgi:hypothetical protein